MRHESNTWILSPTDLSEFLACSRLTTMKARRALGQRDSWPKNDSAHTAIVQRRGDEHEAAMIARLEAEGQCAAFDLGPAEGEWPGNAGEMVAATERTLEAMKAGHQLIVQAALFDASDAWFGSGDPSDELDDGSEGDAHRFGFVDVLRRVPIASPVLGEWSYEVVEIKLARQPRPKFVHQLSVYSRIVGKLQGLEPQVGFLLLGEGSEVEIRLDRYSAVHAHVERGLRRFVTDPPKPAAVPEPVEHCKLCPLSGECRDLRVEADHLSLVANLGSSARRAIEEHGIKTLEALGAAEGPAPDGVSDTVWFKGRNQAKLQAESRRIEQPIHRNLEPADGMGYSKLPPPHPGDMFFDLEGDPYEGSEGIEFLWGWTDADDRYTCVWAHDEEGEKQALEHFIDAARARWIENPGMHVFHYAPHEKVKLKSLAQKYETRERELDELLRGKVIVDLYEIVRQALQVGEEGYSLKQLERHHGFEREEHSVRDGGGAIVAYENYLLMRDQDDSYLRLDAIADYNREDCASTRSLRDWLWNVTLPEAKQDWPEARFAYDSGAEPSEASEPAKFDAAMQLAERLRESVEAGRFDEDEASGRNMLANLLLYHRREEKVWWWRFFELDGMTSDELVDEVDAVGGLVRDLDVEPWKVDRSHAFAFTVPPQVSRVKPNRMAAVLEYPDAKAGGSVHEIKLDQDRPGAVVIKKQPGKDGVVEVPPDPRGVIEGKVPTDSLQVALAEVAQDLLAGQGVFDTAAALLRRDLPKASDGAPLGLSPGSLIADTLALGGSVLPVQGPPGTGKTYNGARMIVEALRAGKRVGVTAPNHKAIMNLLMAVEERAAAEGFEFRGGYVTRKGESSSWVSPHGFIDAPKSNPEALVLAPGMRLVAGTAWFFTGRREEKDATHSVDLLFVDEAGQYPLANAVAAATATRGGLVLLGDPQQLPQVSQAIHPDGAECSVLEHLFGDHDTVPEGAGVLLDTTWRLHPDICRFNSWLSYEGRLQSSADCSLRQIDSPGRLSGAGLMFVPVEHTGRQQASLEEADAIAGLCRELLDEGATVKGPIGIGRAFEERLLQPSDIKVVAPYNLAVDAIARVVPEGVEVGTVDRFQGQEAPILFYAMTCSSAEDAPRGMGFLFDDHRLNVAVSRAQCLAVLVANPRLLDASAKSIEQLELVNGVCRFVGSATTVDARTAIPATMQEG